MIFGFPVNIENTIAIYSYSTHHGPFSLKNDGFPLILCFDLVGLWSVTCTEGGGGALEKMLVD